MQAGITTTSEQIATWILELNGDEYLVREQGHGPVNCGGRRPFAPVANAIATGSGKLATRGIFIPAGAGRIKRRRHGAVRFDSLGRDRINRRSLAAREPARPLQARPNCGSSGPWRSSRVSERESDADMRERDLFQGTVLRHRIRAATGKGKKTDLRRLKWCAMYNR